MRPASMRAATESAAASSIGYWRIRADYAEGDTFDQELKSSGCSTPSPFFWTRSRKTHPQDARYGFIVAEMPKEDFEAEYPDAQVMDITGITASRTSSNGPRLSVSWWPNTSGSTTRNTKSGCCLPVR